MKAYVIKNKEGKYFTISSFDLSFTDDIRESCIFQDWEGADHDLDRNEFEDCEVVEITIAEGDLEKEIEHWHNLFKQKEQQFQSVRERYHLLNRLQANYDKKDKLHLSEMQCLELVEKNEKLEQQLAEKDKQIKYLKDLCEEERLRAIELQQQTREEKTMFDMYRANTIQKGIVDPKATKIIRKQVCDEIMEELKENVDCYFEERKCNSPHSQLPYIWFNEIRFRKFLDQIEQGE